MNFFDLFLDPLIRAPLIGSMLMCLSAGLIGSIVFLRKESLLGEALSHAAYPGIAIGLLIGSFFEDRLFSVIFGGAATALLGLLLMQYLKKRLSLFPDSAMTFVLALFFGIGVTLSSYLQFSFSTLYREMLLYLYGQAATMTDRHVLLYLILSALTVLLFAFFYKEIKAILLDRNFALLAGLPVKRVDFLMHLLMVLAIALGMRSVGVVLISAMLIAPAVSARQFTFRFFPFIVLSSLFGMFFAFVGTVLSLQSADIPTGPAIVLVASLFTLLSLLFAPKSGRAFRFISDYTFERRCLMENLLKLLVKEESLSERELSLVVPAGRFRLKRALAHLKKEQLIQLEGSEISLTESGKMRGKQVIRLHRLFEVYLADYLGVNKNRVHLMAEEIEHVLTPELEEELEALLGDPKIDPHGSPIPQKERPS